MKFHKSNKKQLLDMTVGQNYAKMTDEGTLGHHGLGTMDMTMLPQKLISKYTANFKELVSE